MGTVLKMAAAHDETENLDAQLYTFEDAWAIYPKKVAKKDAQIAWARCDPKHYPTIMRVIPIFRKTDQWRDGGGKFIPHFATFLNKERFLDEVDSDLTMGQCGWNRNGNRGPGGQCQEKAVTEKNGVVYCKRHGEQV